jgi:hypothetical protein
MIRKGDTVSIRPEWRDPGDEAVQFVAMQDEDGGRVLIGALGVLSRFTPTQIIPVTMLEAPCAS